MSRIIFDIETDNLLPNVSTIWCISTLDLDTEESHHFIGDQIPTGIDYLYYADLLIGHNICGFDIPVMERLYKFPYFDLDKCRDTYVMSKLFFPTRLSHGLESYGAQFKREKPEHEDWTRYSEEMKVRCDEDVQINKLVYEWMVAKECKDWPRWKNSIILEGKMHYWQTMQEIKGVGFDKERAEELVAQLDKEIAELDEKLYKELPLRCVQVGVEVKKPFKKNGDYTKMVEDWFNECTDTV